jgi:FdhE protein
MTEVGGPKTGLINIGQEAKPPFAVVPDASVLFLRRSQRLTTLAPGHALGPYLQFLAALTRAQHEVQADLPQALLPPFARIGRALAHGMPPLSYGQFEPDAVAAATIERLLARISAIEVPTQTATAVAALRAAFGEEWHKVIVASLNEADPETDLSQRALVMAGLQVHFARMAMMLRADDLKPIADGVCPACGGAPMASSVVGWPKAHNTRFCTCSLCGTMWHVVRIKCVVCSATGGIGYQTIEGNPDDVKAETCDTCRRYVKILYEVNNPALDPLADDVASLGLDMLLAAEGWKRGGRNPFLLGY